MTTREFCYIISLAYGGVPKRLKGLVSKTSRRESVRGFESPLLRFLRDCCQTAVFLCGNGQDPCIRH